MINNQSFYCNKNNQIKLNQMQKKFYGEFQEDNYTVKKTFLDTEQRNVRLYHTKFTPKDPQYSMCIIHGFGEHSGRFYPIADYYANKGFEVLLIDLRGFGYSGAPRGCSTVPKLMNDVIRLLREARQDLPLFMYAHSLGGLITIKLLLERPGINIAGCIITSPLLGFPKDRELPWAKLQLIKLIGDKMEDFVINSMVNPTALTKNNKYISSIFEDRLMIPFLSIKMGKSIIQSTEQVKKHMHEFNFPVIVFHGKCDSVTNFEDSKAFVYSRVAPFKQLHLFQNGFHELQHDVEKDELLDKSLKFIESLPRKPIVGKLSILPIQTKKKSDMKYIYIAMSIIVLLLILKRAKNINILQMLIGILSKKK